MVRQGKILGHVVSNNNIPIDFNKIKIILELPRPKNAKQEQGFMGHVDIIVDLSTCMPS